MSSPIGIPTLTRSGSKLVSPASSFPSRGGSFRTHSLTEDQQTYPLSHSESYRSHQEPLLLQEQRSRSRSQVKFRKDEERGLLRREIPTVWHEIGCLCRLAGPMVCVNLLQYSITVVSVAFVGHLGELELASASIANSMAGVLGYYVLVSSIYLFLWRYWIPIGYQIVNTYQYSQEYEVFGMVEGKHAVQCVSILRRFWIDVIKQPVNVFPSH